MGLEAATKALLDAGKLAPMIPIQGLDNHV
jgi:hypothetical protein